jgi:hypothetical protein
MEGTTSISELPSENKNTLTNTDVPGNYKPINVHPNPYGISDQNPIMPNPEQTQQTQKTPQQNIYLEGNTMGNMPQQRLPSRDIPMDTTQYAQDNQVQPDYIPIQEHITDYVRDHEKMNAENVLIHEQKKSRAEKIEYILNEFQTPILVAILYFIFQTPYLNKVVFKKFSFLNLTNSDGNFNIYGLILKSLLFGFSYYAFYTITIMLSEF